MLIARDCAQLSAQVWYAEEPLGGIIMLHNFGDYHASFEEIAPAFKDAGYTVLAYDQRGFGRSGERGRWYGQQKLVQDARDALTVLQTILPDDAPTYALGESMGGSVALVLAAQSAPVDGLILAAPGVREGIDYRGFWDALLWMGSAITPAYTVQNPRGEKGSLTQTAQQRLSQSPLVVTQVRLDTYDGLIDLTDAASAAAGSVNLPILIFYGEKDDTVAPVAIDNARKAIERVTFKSYPQAPHLVLQSTVQDDAIKTALTWLAAQEQ